MPGETLKQRIHADMITAMKAKDSSRLGTIRMLQAAIKQREVDERIELTDSDVINVLNKMIKQRQESAQQFTAASRPELADKEEVEINILQTYMPTALSESEVDELIKQALIATAANGIKDMGKVMTHLKDRLQGRADMSLVSNKIKTKLA
jgi:uncharacterized protein